MRNGEAEGEKTVPLNTRRKPSQVHTYDPILCPLKLITGSNLMPPKLSQTLRLYEDLTVMVDTDQPCKLHVG
jgi:hypothetical protein